MSMIQALDSAIAAGQSHFTYQGGQYSVAAARGIVCMPRGTQEGSRPTAASVSAKDRWNQLCQAKRAEGLSAEQAAKAIAHEHPALRQRVVAEANSKQPVGKQQRVVRASVDRFRQLVDGYLNAGVSRTEAVKRARREMGLDSDMAIDWFSAERQIRYGVRR